MVPWCLATWRVTACPLPNTLPLAQHPAPCPTPCRLAPCSRMFPTVPLTCAYTQLRLLLLLPLPELLLVVDRAEGLQC